MATTERVMDTRDVAGIAVLVVCNILSLISVLGVFVILGVSAVQSRHSSDRKLFVRTQPAKYVTSLLICNAVQSFGGIINIVWLAENRVYVGVACTAQAALKQLGNGGPAIFTFVIAVHTFCHLFLSRQWSNRTCNIVLVASWAVLLFELCIENFALADPEKGPYYGITTAGFWCWISPKYLIERYTTDYLFMTASATFSFILYLPVFFKLRGNIQISAGYKIVFRQRPATRFGRTCDGALVMTDDHSTESYLTTVAKHMLWYPIVYILLIVPVSAARLCAFRGEPVPHIVTILVGVVFMLHGVFNTVLFCTTRNILPKSWRERIGLSTAWEDGRGNVGQPSTPSATCRFTGARAGRTGTFGTGPSPVAPSVHVEDMETNYEAGPSASCVESASPTSSVCPAPLLRVHGGSGKLADAHEHHILQLSSAAPRGTRVDEDDKGSDLGVGVDLESMAKVVEWEVPQHPGHASSEHGSGAYGPARV